MSFTSTSPFWVSDQVTAVSTLYNGAGTPQTLVVSTPPGPTGQVSNGTTGFQLSAGNPARFIFDTLSGDIAGWNPTVNANTAVTMFAATDGAVYTGLASGSVGTNQYLYAADFKNARIDVFDSSFHPVTLTGPFSDPNLPAGYSPYNIQNINGNLYVEYALPNPTTGRASFTPGTGAVDIFDASGNLLTRVVTNGPLDSPWGVTIAPANFGAYSNDLLVGNFGSGTIDVFDPTNNYAFLGALSDSSGSPIVLSGLWALDFRAAGSAFPTNALYFTAGINGEADGLFGSIDPVPEPGSWLLAGLGLAAAYYGRKRRLA